MPWCVAPPKMLRWKIYTEQLWQILRSDVPVINIDNVADYYFAGTGRKTSPTWRHDSSWRGSTTICRK
jgi:hypothetical protein